MTFSVPYLIGALLVFLSRWRSVAIYLRLTGPQTDLAVGLLALATLALGFAAGVSFVQFLSAVGTVEEYYGLQGEWAFNKATLPPSRLEKYLALMRKAMQRNDWDDANYELRKIKLRYHLFSGSA